jgi:hypothetical protein
LNIDLAGKTAVVTGSSEGIGYTSAHVAHDVLVAHPLVVGFGDEADA